MKNKLLSITLTGTLLLMSGCTNDSTDTFIYCDNFADGNLYQCIYPQGSHDRNTVARILYNGLPKMFG